MIQFKFVSYIHKHRAILSNINIKFEEGEFVYILGPSSSGKTTLLKLIAGVIKPTGGSLMVMGKNMKSLSSDKLSLIRKKMGLIMDEFGFVKGSVEKNLEIILSNFPKEERRPRIDYALNLVELTRKRRDDISLLSLSEKKQISLIRAIITDPLVILADEPVCCCDKKKEALIIDILKKMQENGTLVILASTRDIPILGKREVRLEDGMLFI
ncbi:MAG: ATP-binding cassette domain-containing protein [bacterium]